MKYYKLLSLCLVLIILFGCGTTAVAKGIRLYDLDRETIHEGEKAIRQLQSARFVLVGEHHNNRRHHEAQLQIIRS